MRNHQIPLNRRTLLTAGLAAAATAAVSCGRGGEGASWRFFTAEEARTVDAICERLIPADQSPGASQAGVVNYIDIQLTKAFKKHRNAYRQGIAAVDESSRRRFGARFAELSPERQVEALKDVERNSRAFFQLILTHTQQGFYGDPRHGGNRHMVSWKMLGLPFPPVRGRQHYDQPPQAG